MSIILALDADNNSDGGRYKYVLVNESKGGAKLKSAGYMTKAEAARRYRSTPLRLSCSYGGVITAGVDIPPVKSAASKVLLFKNKMRDELKAGTEYSFIYFENPGGAEPPKVNYTVYAAPDRVLTDITGIKESDLTSVKSFTFDFFSVMAVSNKFNGKETVFHAYGDRSRIIIVVSTGRRVEYTRSNEVPGDIKTEEELTNFYYENINLTYLYVRQSFSGVGMKILLTGNISKNGPLKESVEKFMDQPVSYPEADKIISGASEEQFQEFLIPIGTVLLGDSFDFSSKSMKENRLTARTLKYVNSAMTAVIAALAFLFITDWNEFNMKKSALETRSSVFFRKETALVRNIGSAADLKTGSDYLNLIRGKTDSPAALLTGVQNLLDFYRFSSVSFSGGGSSAVVNIKADKPQNDFLSLEEFNKQINEKINEAEKDRLKATDGSVHTLKELKNRINVTVSPEPRKNAGGGIR